VLYPIALLVVAANTFNIGSDIGAMAASTKLLMPMLPLPLFAIGFSALIIFLEVFIAYRVYIVVAIFGTTISSYLFFWQTSNTVEDEIVENRTNTDGAAPTISRRYLSRLRVDTVIGMFFSNLVAWFIILVGAVVLNSADVTNIVTAADAAKALKPLVHSFPNSGYLGQVIFATGVIAIGLMSIPVLAGSSAYAISETFKDREGLSKRFGQARTFYVVIVLGTMIGLGLNFIDLDPVKALVLAAVINGIVAVPLIFVIARLSSRHDIMGTYRSRFWSNLGLWTAFEIMALAAVALLISIM
jgi:Mn2+/Fe2+ NRAMP family transporter